jgi:hypothetical protein
MTTTTQPTPTPSVGKGASRIFEGFQFFQRRIKQEHPTVLTYEQGVEEITKALGCNCGGRCQSCQHIIKDVLGNP